MARYRDTKTGKFVSKKTYKASRARGGVRYKRVSVKQGRLPVPRKKAVKLPRPRPRREEEEFFEEDFIEDEEAEYGGAFDSPGGKNK